MSAVQPQIRALYAAMPDRLGPRAADVRAAFGPSPRENPALRTTWDFDAQTWERGRRFCDCAWTAWPLQDVTGQMALFQS